MGPFQLPVGARLPRRRSETLVDFVGLRQASSCTCTLGAYYSRTTSSLHNPFSQQILISLYQLPRYWGHSGLPTIMGTPMGTSMGTSRMHATRRDHPPASTIGPVQSIGSERSTEAGLDCWPHLKILPARGPRSHRPWDPRAGQLSRWASRSCILLHIASVTSLVHIHKVGGILQITSANPR